MHTTQKRLLSNDLRTQNNFIKPILFSMFKVKGFGAVRRGKSEGIIETIEESVRDKVEKRRNKD